MIGVQEYRSRVQHLRKSHIETRKFVGAQPVQGCRADHRVETFLSHLADPAWISKIDVKKSHPLAMSVGFSSQTQQDRITVDANHLGLWKTISNGVAERTGAASQIQDPQGPVPGVDGSQHLQHCSDTLVTEFYESGLLNMPGGEQFLRVHSFSFDSVSGLKIRWVRFSCAMRRTRR